MNPAHRSYQELCSDPALCPLGTVPSDEFIQGTARLFSHWEAENSGEQLCEDVIVNLGSRLNGALVVIVENARATSGVLRVLHGVARSAVAAFYREPFAYLGDLQGMHIETVRFNTDWLSTTDGICILSEPARHLQLLAATEDKDLLPPPGDNEDSKIITTRPAMFLPYPLVPHLIDQDLTAYEALDLLLPIIDDLGIEATCLPLLDWLVAASTAADADGAPSPLRQANAGLAPQGLRKVRAERDEDLLYRQLPILKPSRGATDPAVLGILQATREQRNAVTAELEDRRADREKDKLPKTIDEKWPDYCNRLLKLCHVEDPTALPDFWHRAAAWKKGSGTTVRGLLQNAVEQAAHALGVPPFQVTVRHANDLQTWMFVGPTRENLSVGLSPFTVTPPTAVSAEALLQREADFAYVQDHTTMMETSTTLTAADARNLRSTNAYIPLDFDELEDGLESFLALLGAVLGTAHPVIPAYQLALRTYRRIQPALRRSLTL